MSYSNLLKTSVALESNFSNHLDRHLKSAMDELKSVTYDLFMSLQEISEHLLWNVGVPLMSTGLIGIAECDPDPTMMSQLAEMLGVNSNQMDPDILKLEVGKQLQKIFRDAIIHEGQCSSITSEMVREEENIDREVEDLDFNIISVNEDSSILNPKKRNFQILNQSNLIDSLQADVYGLSCSLQGDSNDDDEDESQEGAEFDLFDDNEDSNGNEIYHEHKYF